MSVGVARDQGWIESLMVSYHARDRRLELEFREDDPVDMNEIEQILASPEALDAVDRGIREELSLGRPLSSDGRRVFMHPGREMFVRTHRGEIHRVNSSTEYVWADRVCYVIAKGVVQTTIHVNEAQFRTLLQIEHIDVSELRHVDIRRRIPMRLQPANSDAPPSSSSQVRAKALPVSELRLMSQPFHTPVWLFQEHAMLSIVIVSPWEQQGAQLSKPLKAHLRRMIDDDAANGLVRSTQFRISAGVANDRIVGLLRKQFGLVTKLRPLPPTDLRKDRSRFESEMSEWWESVRDNMEDKRIFILVTPDEARNLLETIAGTSALRKYEVQCFVDLVHQPDGLRPFAPRWMIDIGFDRLWENEGLPKVGWSQY